MVMIKRVFVAFFLVLFTVTACFGRLSEVSNGREVSTGRNGGVYGMIGRVLPGRQREFVLETIAKQDGCDVFEIAGVNARIVIRGSSPIALASGFNWYLKHVANCHVSWCGDQLNLPASLPRPEQTIRRQSPYKHGCCFNYCTFNYTMSWWNWERWEREIDYMALCGIDMPLMVIGSEALWMNVLKRFNYSDAEAKAFIAGPAYTAWWMMGNLQGRGGPVTDQWIEERTVLAKKILARMRSLGMHPAVPGFVGLVPGNFAKKNPGAKVIPQGSWVGLPRPFVLHPDDPMFGRFAHVWYEEMEKIYGKADVIAGDLFHEGGRTAGLDLTEVAKQVQGHMLEHNPDAVWIIQAWGGNPKNKLLAGLKKENTLVQDLCCEFWRRWESRKGFNNFPWCFGTIIMYGGNVALHGRLDAIADNLNAALNSSTPPVALGTFWESIEVNPVVMDFLWDVRWRDQCPDLDEWIQQYAVRRYGVDTPQLREAWLKILNSAYGSYKGQRRPGESLFCAKPSMNVRKASPFAASIKVRYDMRELRDAIGLLLTASNQCGDVRGYQFDIVDMTRQFMANTGQLAYREMIATFRAGDRAAFDMAVKTFFEMFDDQERLLSTEPLYMLGQWLKTARDIAGSEAQADINERNARLLITTWTTEKSSLRDYAWREWAGLLSSYYRPRWKAFTDDLSSQLDGNPAKNLDYYPMEAEWAKRKWKNDSYPVKPQGDPVEEARRVFNRWSPWLDRHYKHTAAPRSKTLHKETGKNREAAAASR